MSRQRFKVCPRKHCPELIPESDRACAAHRAEVSRSRATKRKQQGYTSGAWKRKAKSYLADHPWCENEDAHPPLQAPRAEAVDHIDGLGPNGPRGFDDRNLQALCRRCHNRKTAQDHNSRA